MFQVVNLVPNLRLEFKNKTTSPKASPHHSSLDGALLIVTEYHGLGTLGLWHFGCSGELKNKDSYMREHEQLACFSWELSRNISHGEILVSPTFSKNVIPGA